MSATITNDKRRRNNGFAGDVLPTNVKMPGNSTNRTVEFEKPLSLLGDKPVKLKFIMKDADIYSICGDI